MEYHGFRNKTEHTVIQGRITNVQEIDGQYYIQFNKYRANISRHGSDFDDLGKAAIASQYHYNQSFK